MWRDAFENWKTDRSECVIAVMNNMYDYHTGRKRAQDADESRIPETVDDSSSDRSKNEGYDSEDVQERETAPASPGFADPDSGSDEREETLESLSAINPRCFPSSAQLWDRRTLDIIDTFERHLLTEDMAKSVVVAYKESLRSFGNPREQITHARPTMPDPDILRE